MSDKIHDECGVFAIFEPLSTTVAKNTYIGLQALQHRGQQSCGIVVSDDGVFRQHKGLGLVNDVFNNKEIEKLDNANMALGHIRYTNNNLDNINNILPIVVRHIKGNLALGYNGKLTNSSELRSHFELNGAIFYGNSDAEVIAYSIVLQRLQSRSIENAVEVAMYNLKGSYSCCLMSPSKLIAFRDPNGFKPLCLGITKNGGYVISSESCAIDTIGAKFIRDILPGEILVISEEGLKSIKTHCQKKKTMCLFEFVNFARPDSVIEGISVHEARLNAGRMLAKSNPVNADVVIGIPDSGLDAAIGYSIESKIPYEIGFIKNKYLNDSSIQQSNEESESTLHIKLNVIRSVIENKRVVLIDDTLIKGTTVAKIIKLLKENGAKEVHVRISSPALKYPCYFGTNIDADNLIASKYESIDDIKNQIGADSLAYLSIDMVEKILPNISLCKACFNGEYPIDIPENEEKDIYDKKINNQN